MKKLSVSMTKTELVLGWIYLFLQMFIVPSALVLINLNLPQPLPDAVINFIFFAINFACILAIFHRFLWRSAQIALMRPGWTLRCALFGFLAYYGLSIVINMIVLYVDPSFANVNDMNIANMAQEHFTLMAVGSVLLVPITEEALFRGILFHTLYNKSRFLGYVVSTILFCLIHVMGYVGSYDFQTLVLCFLQYIPAGLCLGWAYVRADTIWAPILIHITINQIAFLAMR